MTPAPTLRPLVLAALLSVAACTRTDPAPEGAGSTAGVADTSQGASAPYPDGGGPAVTPIPNDAWVVSEGGVGPVRVGMAAEVAEESMGADARLMPASPGSTCRYLDWTDRHPGVAYMSVDGRVVRLDVSGLDQVSGGEATEIPAADLPRTAEGVGVGSTEAEVTAAYGARVRSEPHKYVHGGHTLVVTPADTASLLVFETDGTRVTSLRAGLRPYAEWVEGCS